MVIERNVAQFDFTALILGIAYGYTFLGRGMIHAGATRSARDLTGRLARAELLATVGDVGQDSVFDALECAATGRR